MNTSNLARRLEEFAAASKRWTRAARQSPRMLVVEHTARRGARRAACRSTRAASGSATPGLRHFRVF